MYSFCIASTQIQQMQSFFNCSHRHEMMNGSQLHPVRNLIICQQLLPWRGLDQHILVKTFANKFLTSWSSWEDNIIIHKYYSMQSVHSMNYCTNYYLFSSVDSLMGKRQIGSYRVSCIDETFNPMITYAWFKDDTILSGKESSDHHFDIYQVGNYTCLVNTSSSGQ